MEMNRILLSLIVPVYNTPIDLVERMLNSVFSQEIGDDVEIIVVDDGSREDYQKEFEQFLGGRYLFKYIKKTHGGLASARNAGSDNALGTYLAYLDSDDTIAANFFLKAREYIKEYSPDVVYGEIEFIPAMPYVQSDDKVDVFCGNRISKVKEALFDIPEREKQYTIIGSACGRLYKKSLFEEIRFNEAIPYSEDQLFNREVLNRAEKVIVVPDKWYQYYSNPSSMVHERKLEGSFEKHKPYWDELYRYNQKECEEYKKRLRIRALGHMYSFIGRNVCPSNADMTSKIRLIGEISEHPLIEDACDNLSLKDVSIKLSYRAVLFLIKFKLFRLLYMLVSVKNNEKW